jgi:transposase InsO family protein
MSRKGNPGDNASCESFMKTLKFEEVLRNEYRDLAEALASIPEFSPQGKRNSNLETKYGFQ